MTTAQVVETLVTVNNNSPIQDYVHPDDQTQPTIEMTPEFNPFTNYIMLPLWIQPKPHTTQRPLKYNDISPTFFINKSDVCIKCRKNVIV